MLTLGFYFFFSITITTIFLWEIIIFTDMQRKKNVKTLLSIMLFTVFHSKIEFFENKRLNRNIKKIELEIY